MNLSPVMQYPGCRVVMAVAVIVVAAAALVGIPAPAHAERAPVVEAFADGPRTSWVEPGPVWLTAAQRRARAELIRDTAAAAGMTNGALLAGIGEVETNFAHCWSEATWACKGPASASCGGGPVIAGSADGACSLQQGGLGMFQFDAGTFAQTVATYGPDIVTLQGNVNAVIPFLVTRAIQSVDGVNSEAEALAWMNAITIANGDAQYERWLYFVAWRYNGCQGCTTQINKYRNGTNKLRDEFGPGFWTITAGEPVACTAVPAEGATLDDTDACFTRGGSPTSWYPGATGQAGGCLYTYATDAVAADNHATWELRFARAGRYRLEVSTDGGTHGQSQQASYVVTHAAGTTEVVIDQSARDGFQVLGEFEFAADDTTDSPFGVTLGDNTGEPYSAAARVSIMFDAVRVVPVGTATDGNEDGEPGAGDDSEAGGCQAGPGAPGGLAGLAGLGLALATRRRRRHEIAAIGCAPTSR